MVLTYDSDVEYDTLVFTYDGDETIPEVEPLTGRVFVRSRDRSVFVIDSPTQLFIGQSWP